MNKPHRHATLIHAWADGAEIEWYDDQDGVWEYESNPSWDEDAEYRIKPEKEYPKSTLTDIELDRILDDCAGAVYLDKCRAIADEAVKRYIQENEE